MVSVVLFSGGRGSDVLSRQLIGHPDVQLTIAINGYDDGASTGEVRRFLGDSLGPSDFRKNASRVARETRSCPQGIIDVLDRRLPDPCSREDALQALEAVAREPRIDVIVLTRGGGSFDDLLPFSDERVVRAVASCPVPVVSAVVMPKRIGVTSPGGGGAGSATRGR